MKRIAIVLMLVLVVVFIWLNRTEQPKVSEAIEPQSLPQVGKRFRQVPANAARPRQQVGVPDPCLQLLSEPVPVGAQPYLVRAVKSAQMIEKEKQTFAKDSNGVRQLEGLQRKLFIDDYNYAALATGQLDSLAYVALQTELKERMDEEIKVRQMMLARQAEHIKDIALAGKSSASYEAVSQDAVAQTMLLQGAYHNVFAFRSTSSHTLEGDPIIHELDKLTLAGAGPELTIPHR